MARMTQEHDALVVRLVYDGPPRSGKTTSLGALARGMTREVFSPAEADGRTLYFDWLEYVGGSFEGLPIRCQILSVPGQRELAARRRALLAEADAVVFVTGSAPESLPATAEHLDDLRAFLASRPAPQPGLIIQANHRDRPDALPLAALRQELGVDELTLIESVATENEGIREAFVLAVRLALDRTRELMARADLPAGRGDTDDPNALLAWLQTAADAPAVPPAAPANPAEPRVPRLPDSGAPTGQVWPPVDGRLLLHAAVPPGAVPRLGSDGSWRLRSGSWQFHSAARHELARPEEGVRELVSWVQKHALAPGRLSPQRCVALAETGWGTWRLWQVARAEESLRQRLTEELRAVSPAGAVPLLRSCAERLLEARAAFAATPPLPCRLDLIDGRQERPVYIGLLPPADWEPSPSEVALSGAELVRREIEPVLRAVGEERGWAVEELLSELAQPGASGDGSPSSTSPLSRNGS